jgi:hypothetical protein
VRCAAAASNLWRRSTYSSEFVLYCGNCSFRRCRSGATAAAAAAAAAAAGESAGVDCTMLQPVFAWNYLLLPQTSQRALPVPSRRYQRLGIAPVGAPGAVNTLARLTCTALTDRAATLVGVWPEETASLGVVHDSRKGASWDREWPHSSNKNVGPSSARRRGRGRPSLSCRSAAIDREVAIVRRALRTGFPSGHHSRASNALIG